MKIGVISDTHNFLDPKIPERFAGVGHILHAGDIGLPWILQELEQVAPVTAVSGNTDDPALRYAAAKTVELAGRKFFIQHIVRPHDLNEDLKRRLARERPDVVVFGHTHQRFCESLNGVLYFNPGYAGQPKLGAERSVAILHCDRKGIRAEYVEL
ncbi:MAG TPA: metallophosphoesterase family protein [Candidatus Limnocylindrales bacterium]|nr:metallophosphoesterase family protein [Candidatus Limnocylindrales bacterium]